MRTWFLLAALALACACNKPAENAATSTTAQSAAAPAAHDDCTPEITQQPAATAIAKGESATLTIVASVPSGKLAYRWYEIGPKESIPLTNETGPSITVKPAKTTSYFAWLYSDCGTKRGQKVTDACVVTVR